MNGGGLVRSSAGWQQIRSAREAGVFLKSDERLLGDSSFVEEVLSAAGEEMAHRDRYRRQGIDLEALVQIVAQLLAIDAGEVVLSGKQPQHVRARSLLCFWAVRELGLSATSVAGTLKITQPAVSLAVRRGERLVREKGWRFENLVGRKL